MSLEEVGLKGQLREMMGHVLEYPPGPRDQQLIQLVPPTLPLQVGYVLLLVKMKNCETMGHVLKYPPGPRDQQLIQLARPHSHSR